MTGKSNCMIMIAALGDKVKILHQCLKINHALNSWFPPIALSKLQEISRSSHWVIALFVFSYWDWLEQQFWYRFFQHSFENCSNCIIVHFYTWYSKFRPNWCLSFYHKFLWFLTLVDALSHCRIYLQDYSNIK